MKIWLSLTSLIVSLSLRLLLIPIQALPARAAGATKWQLNDIAYTGTLPNFGLTQAYYKLMSLAPPSGGSKEVTVPAGQGAVWYFDQNATLDVSLGTANWRAEAHFGVDSDTETDDLIIQTWKVNPSDGSATMLAAHTLNVGLSTTLSRRTIENIIPDETSQEILLGWTIACLVKWGGSKGLKIGYDNDIAIILQPRLKSRKRRDKDGRCKILILCLTCPAFVTMQQIDV